MEDRQYSQFKRAYEYYQADPKYRALIREEPSAAVTELGLPDCDGKLILEVIEYILFRNTQTDRDQPYIREFTKRIGTVSDQAVKMVSADRYRDLRIAGFVQRTLNRARLESAIFRAHTNIRYFPLGFELSEGCKVHCPFCGLNARKWSMDYSYKEGRKLWLDLLEASKEVIGDITDQAPLYYATEPLDNPDYEAFLGDVMERFPCFPQTTTAVPERDIERTRRLMDSIGRERLVNGARLRFTIRTLSQFKKIMEAFSPQELEGVELIMNNPESVNGISASGRLLGTKDGSSVYGDRHQIRYSISCLSGVKINLCEKTMTFMQPHIPDEKYPEGVLVSESVRFTEKDDIGALLKGIFERNAKADLCEDMLITLNDRVRIIEKENELILAGDGIGYSLKRNMFTEELLRKLQNTETGIRVSEIENSFTIDEGSKGGLQSLIKEL
nr:hypothetical protein [Lachnospiraceae bacterium]